MVDTNDGKVEVIDPNNNDADKSEGAEESIVVIGENQYTLNESGDALDKEGNVFKTKAELEAEFEEQSEGTEGKEVEIEGKTYKLDAEGNAIDDQGLVFKTKEELTPVATDINIASLKELIQVTPVTNDGKEIIYEDTPEGISNFIKDATQIVANSMFQNQIGSFFEANPDIRDIYRHKQLYGTIENYKATVDYSSIEFDEKNDDLVQNLIINARLTKGDSLEEAKKYVAYLKNDNADVEEAKKSLDFLKGKQTERDKAISKQQEAMRQREEAEDAAYWSQVKKVVNSGKLNINGQNIPIPEVVTIKDSKGRGIPMTRNDFINYISTPVKYKLEDGSIVNWTRNQIDIHKSRQNITIDTELYEAWNRFTNQSHSSVVEAAINAKEVSKIRTLIAKGQSSGGKNEGNKGGAIKFPIK